MFRGTTPTFIFELDTDLDLTELSQVWVTIRDVLGRPFNWDISRVTIDNEHKRISLTLTQQETLQMIPGVGHVQIRMLMSGNVALTTFAEKILINPILKEGVITSE